VLGTCDLDAPAAVAEVRLGPAVKDYSWIPNRGLPWTLTPESHKGGKEVRKKERVRKESKKTSKPEFLHL